MALAAAGFVVVVAGAVVAALLLGRSEGSADTTGDLRDPQPTDSAATETAEPTPAQLRQSLADAGLDCGELGPYVAEPGELNIGFEPREAVTCTAASGSTVELVFMESAEELATLLAVTQGFACGFDAVDQTIVYGETWYAEVFTTDGSVDQELTTAAADALGVDEQAFDCS